MRGFLLAGLTMLGLCLVAMAVAMTPLPALGYVGLGATGAAALAGSWALTAARQVRAVRRLVCSAYRADAVAPALVAVAEALRTPDVLQARSDYLRREAATLAQRYQNGDASDY